MRGKRLTITLAVGIGVAIGLGLSWLWPGSEFQRRDVMSRNLDDAKFFAMALHEYAAEHDGVYPRYLSELVPDYLGAWDYVRYSAMDARWKPMPKYDWLYFASGHDGNHLPRIIIASPQAVNERNAINARIVVYDDLSILVIPEAQYQRELRQMSEGMKKPPRRPVPRETPEVFQARNVY